MSKQTADDEENKPQSTETDSAVEAEQSIGVDDSPALNLSYAEMNSAQAVEKVLEFELAAQQAQDDLLRVQAEMQNLRRRSQMDVEKAHKYGQEKFAAELLGVMDNLERALASASANSEGAGTESGLDEGKKIAAIYEGVDLTLKSFVDCFNKFNITVVDPLGEPFDPELHQAMSIQENPDVEPNTVIAVMQKGYTLYGRVIRPAMVVVSKA
jgi:molecular chaperone GrpE